MSEVVVHDLEFAYEGADAPLFSNLSAAFPRGFTGIVGANGTGKTTLLSLVAGELLPVAGTIQGSRNTICCEQRTDRPPADLATFLADWDAEAFELRRRLGVEEDFLERWTTLSHGERKRAQIAWALWHRPDVLAIDEPTNHIDSAARRRLIDALQRFRGVGLIVSHDRELLDLLCVQCLWLEPPNTLLVPGGYSKARDQKAQNHESALRERNKAAREQKRLEREMATRRQQASRSHQNRSKGGLAIRDHDARFKKNLARLTGKDGQAGRLLRQLEGRAARSEERLAQTQVEKVRDVSIWLPGSRSRRDTLLFLEAGEVALAPGRALRFPQLVIGPEDRIAVTGPNGLGKSTLIRHLLPLLNVPEEHLVVLPQEVDAAAARHILSAVRALPRAQLGHVMNVISRLGSRPQRLLESRQPSPGELRKLLLAQGMARLPHVIVMDEPTNHLDLPSIEALEQALSGCPCALLLVSHDRRFLEHLTHTSWQLTADPDGHAQLGVEREHHAE